MAYRGEYLSGVLGQLPAQDDGAPGAGGRRGRAPGAEKRLCRGSQHAIPSRDGSSSTSGQSPDRGRARLRSCLAWPIVDDTPPCSPGSTRMGTSGPPAKAMAGTPQDPASASTLVRPRTPAAGHALASPGLALELVPSVPAPDPPPCWRRPWRSQVRTGTEGKNLQTTHEGQGGCALGSSPPWPGATSVVDLAARAADGAGVEALGQSISPTPVGLPRVASGGREGRSPHYEPASPSCRLAQGPA